MFAAKLSSTSHQRNVRETLSAVMMNAELELELASKHHTSFTLAAVCGRRRRRGVKNRLDLNEERTELVFSQVLLLLAAAVCFWKAPAADGSFAGRHSGRVWSRRRRRNRYACKEFLVKTRIDATQQSFAEITV